MKLIICSILFYIASLDAMEHAAPLSTLTEEKISTLEGSETWWKLARLELAAALNVKDNWGIAKNVILFLGDGMGVTASTAARIYKGQQKKMHGEEEYLEWERFPNSALIKTYNVDRQVPDSAATATAFLCGVKANFQTLGIDPSVKLNDCKSSLKPENHLSSILEWAQKENKATGIVTSTRITHATPAATYAHSAHRNWECNAAKGTEGEGCPDIALQLVHNSPGNNIKVILGGGRQPLGGTLLNPDLELCNRTDNRDLTQEWLDSKVKAGHKAKYITSATQLRDVGKQDFLMGLFADTHIPYVADQKAANNYGTVNWETPTLSEMATTAVNQLADDKDGFFLLVEGGRIDHGLHNNNPLRAFEETLAFDEAIRDVLELVDLDETLVVVTADHSHVITINGYPQRGNNILGNAQKGEIDNIDYTTIMFTNGPGWNFTAHTNETTGEVTARRADPNDLGKPNPLDSPLARAQTVVATGPDRETHGGEDVALYAAGPMAHLFHRLHEQNYIAHVMAYASCIGPSAGKHCKRPKRSNKRGKSSGEHFSLPHSEFTRNSEPFHPDLFSAPGGAKVNPLDEAITAAASADVSRKESLGETKEKTPKSLTSEKEAEATTAEEATKTLNDISVNSIFKLVPVQKIKTSHKGKGAKVPSLPSALQLLIDSSQQRLISALGVEKIKETKTLTHTKETERLFFGDNAHVL